MKVEIVSLTALQLAIGLATPVLADVQCRESSAVRQCTNITNWHVAGRVDGYDDYDDYDEGYSDINQIYREVLGRNADREGLQTYSEELDDGQSLRDIRKDIASGREARDMVKRIYRELVGRSADGDTIRDYTRRLGRGWTLSDVRADIVGSDEFRERTLYRRRQIGPPLPPGVVEPMYRRPAIAPPPPVPPLPPLSNPSRRPPIVPLPPGKPY